MFVAAVIEGPIATVLAGYLVNQSYLNIYSTYATVVIADLVGDSLYYLLGRYGSHIVETRLGKTLRLPEKMAKIEERYKAGGGKLLLIGKLTHAAGFPILVGAGSSHMPYGRFLVFNLLGTVPKSLFFLIIGVTLGSAYKQIDAYITRVSFGIIIAAVALSLAYLLYKKSRS